MDPEFFYIAVIPQKLTLNKSIIYQVHPLTRYQLHLIKNSELYETMKGWVHAGNHNGVIQFGPDAKMQFTVDATSRTNFFTLKLIQASYSLFSNDGMINKIQKEELLGKHNLFIKKYLSKFTQENVHFFQQNSHIANNFTLHYHVFVERTPQGLDRIVQENQRLNFQNRPRRGSVPDSIKSSTFSDKINDIEVKGQNRFAQKAHVFMQGHFGGSESKLSPQFQSLNLKSVIRRSGDQHVRPNIYQKNIFKPKNYNQPITERKTRDTTFQQLEQQFLDKKQEENHEKIASPPLQPIKLKKLTSQEIKVTFDLYSPNKLTRKKIHQDKNLSHQEKKKKLLQEFQRKRLEFKKRIDSERTLASQIIEPQNDFSLKRSNSMRSMKSLRSIRLIELERLPEEKPWIKKEKEKTKKLEKKIMYSLIVFLCILLVIVMRPNKNFQSEQSIIVQWQSSYMEKNRIQTEKKGKQKKPKIPQKK